MPATARSWIALISALAVTVVAVAYFSLATSSKASVAEAAVKSSPVGDASQVADARQQRIDKYLDDYRTIHQDAPTERRKFLDSAAAYVNDRIAQSGETWHFDKVTGKPVL